MEITKKPSSVVGLLARCQIAAGKKVCGSARPILQASHTYFLKGFNQSFVEGSHFLPPSVEELLSIWKIFRIIGTNRLFQLCNYFNVALKDVCFWVGFCYEKPAKQDCTAGVTDRQTGELTCSPWKCWAFFTPKATERLFIEQFWFCHYALAVVSHSDWTLLLCAFQRNSLSLRTKWDFCYGGHFPSHLLSLSWYPVPLKTESSFFKYWWGNRFAFLEDQVWEIA